MYKMLSILMLPFLLVGAQVDFLSQVSLPAISAKYQAPAPSWMMERIIKELSPYLPEKRVSLRALDRTYQSIAIEPLPPYYRSAVRYRFVNGEVYRLGELTSLGAAWDDFFTTLATICHSLPFCALPDVDFIINLNDGTPLDDDPLYFWVVSPEQDQAPIFTYAKYEGEPYLISMPDFLTIAYWHKIVKDILEANKRHPWEAKKKMACWGGQIGDHFRSLWGERAPYLVEHYVHRPRYQICELAYFHPDLIRASLNKNLSMPKVLNELMNPFYNEWLSFDDQIAHAYLPVIDGRICTYPGYLWRLLSNSVAFKQMTSTSQWFYDALKPYVHYVPVSYNLGNLVEQIRWAREHDEECRQIAERATQFVKDNLMMEDIFLYQFYLLREYAKCQDFTVEDLTEDTNRDPRWVKVL